MDNWSEVAKKFPGRVDRVVGEFIWRPETKDRKPHKVVMRIEIHQLHDGRFQAFPDHEMKPGGLTEPFVSAEIGATPEDALDRCLAGYMKVMEDPADTVWLPSRYSQARETLHRLLQSQEGDNTD
jgi:hypothetical protein